MRGFSRLGVLLLIAAPAFAQAPIEPAKLPAQTLLYIRSNGLRLQPDSAQKNSLLALWNDPEFAPVRAAILEGKTSGSAKHSKGSRFTAADFQQFLPLLENPLVFGVILRTPDPLEATGKLPLLSPRTATILVYDASGKEGLVRQFLDKMRENEAGEALVPFNEGTVKAEMVVRKSGTIFRGFAGHNFVVASDEGAFKYILRRLANEAGTGESLGESSAFAEAQKEIQPGSTLEFFLQVPDLARLAILAPAAKRDQIQALVKGLRTDALHAVCASVSFDGAETGIRGAILGDTSKGTLFDVVPDGSAPMASLALVPASAVSYTASQFDLLAFYQVLRGALEASLPPNQAGMVPMAEGIAAMKLGMPLEGALRVISGEYASFATRDDLDARGNVYAFAITNKPDGLKLLHSLAALAGDRVAISNEHDAGDATFLAISLGKQQNAGSAQVQVYAAVTPSFILGSLQEETLRTLLASSAAGSPRLNSTPGFLKARSRFPEKVINISYADFSRVNWDAALSHMIEQMKAGQGAKGDTPKKSETFELLKPEVLKRHLHTTAGASWKDAHGIHFDGWIQ
jgi:hypothetical protein